MQSYKLGFIGAGKMAEAIINGIINSNLIAKENICFYEISEIRKNYILDTYAITAKDIQDVIHCADIILFCVKPQNIQHLLNNFPEIDLSEKAIISILAGTPISLFKEYLGKEIQIVRVMPNTPALISSGMSALAFSETITKAYKEFIIEIFSSLGQVVIVSEKDMDIVTGISGSGPAFLYRIANDIAEVGHEHGLSYDTSLKLIAQTMVGAGLMIQQSHKLPSNLIVEVASPGGTTMAGLDQFDKTQIDSEIKSVIQATIKRSKELSNK